MSTYLSVRVVRGVTMPAAIIMPMVCNHYTMYDAYPYFSLKNLSKTVHVIHSKIRQVFLSAKANVITKKVKGFLHLQ